MNPTAEGEGVRSSVPMAAGSSRLAGIIRAVVGASALCLLAGCTTTVSYFDAIESGPEEGQYFVSVVSDTYSGSNLVSRQSAIVEYRTQHDGTWMPARVVVEGVQKSDLTELLGSAPPDPDRTRPQRGSRKIRR